MPRIIRFATQASLRKRLVNPTQVETITVDQYVAGWTETQLGNWLVNTARSNGWLVTHFRPARTKDGKWVTAIQGDAGFPDWVLARNGYVILAELKRSEGFHPSKLSAEQVAWGNHLAVTCPLFLGFLEEGRFCYHVWRPTDKDLIEAHLS